MIRYPVYTSMMSTLAGYNFWLLIVAILYPCLCSTKSSGDAEPDAVSPRVVVVEEHHQPKPV